MTANLHKASVQPNNHSSRKFHSLLVSPKVPACNYNVATINYELNVLRSRGPRRMHCILNSIPISAIQEGGTALTPATFLQYSSSQAPKGKDTIMDSNAANLPDPPALSQGSVEYLVLKNKAPRWHDQLQSWCLNFRGRVAVASVKNFALAAVVDPSHNVNKKR